MRGELRCHGFHSFGLGQAQVKLWFASHDCKIQPEKCYANTWFGGKSPHFSKSEFRLFFIFFIVDDEKRSKMTFSEGAVRPYNINKDN